MKPWQILDDATISDSTRTECLCVLVRICRTREILPGSYTLPGTPLNTTSYPIAYGAVADIYEGDLGNLNICIKQARARSEDLLVPMV
jgi:hypothetical protein